MTTDAMHPPFTETRDDRPARSAGWLERLTDAICCLAAAGTVLVVLAQVVSRLLGAPISWSEELTRALFIWMVFMGLAASMRSADAARVTVFLQALPRSVRRLSLPIYLSCSIGFFILMAWMGGRMVRQQLAMNESIATLGWPSWVIGLVIPVSAAIAILCTLASVRDHRAAIALADDPANASDTP
jgi:TRAP-type C4-dicarboxylate transport system permease small subunit